MKNLNNKNTTLDKIKKLILGQTITIYFKSINESLKKTGMVIKIDTINNLLYLPNTTIPFTDIISIITPVNYR